MGYFQVGYGSRVVIYDRRALNRLTKDVSFNKHFKVVKRAKDVVRQSKVCPLPPPLCLCPERRQLTKQKNFVHPSRRFLSSSTYSLFLSETEDSDSESETSSEEEVTQNGSSSGGRRTSGTGSSGGQKRHRKKRGVAIPVATPKVPTLPPTTAMPRLPASSATQELEKGEL